MYAVGHTSHTLISLSDGASAKVEQCKANCKKTFSNVYYRRVIKNETWSFLETYEDAKAHQAMLFLDGGQA